MNNFDEAENLGRGKFERLCSAGIMSGERIVDFTTDPYCFYDFAMTSKTGTSIGEIKNLDRPYTKYPNFQIDLPKLRRLLEEANRQNCTPLLVVFFSDCTLVWDISTLEDEIEDRAKKVWCTTTTADNYNRGTKEKTETFLYSNETLWSGTTTL